MSDNHSLSHSKWNCKYHIVFAPKYRRREVYHKRASKSIFTRLRVARINKQESNRLKVVA